MAQKVVTLYTDDLTGEESAEIATYTVLVNGVGVEIDLTPDSHDKLLEALAPFLNATGARRVRGSSKGQAKAKRAAAGNEDTALIRAWAKDNGYDVNDRGRVPSNIRDAYESANS